MGQKKSIAYALAAHYKSVSAELFPLGCTWLALKITTKVWTFLHK